MANPWGLDSPALLSHQGGDLTWLSLDEGDLLDLDFPVEELPLVSSNPHVAQAVPEGVLPADDVGAADPPAQSAPLASELRHWRCLTCTGACSYRCTPPPLAQQVDAYCLVGQQGHKNGEKLLRTALVACDEWRDSKAREAAARAAEQEGLPDLAATLSAKDSSRLRKAQFIWLCRHWGYASRFWQRKHSGPGRAEDSQPRRRRRVDVGAVDEALHIVTPPSRLLLGGQEGALVALTGAVRPALLSVSSWRAEAAEAHFREARGAGIDWSRVRNMQGALEMNRFMRDAVELKQEALQQYRIDLDEGALWEAAYALETRSITPESELDALRTIIDGGMTVTTAAAARIRQQLGGQLPKCEEAYADSFRQGHAAIMLMIHVLHSAVARRRFDSSLAALLEEAEACLEVLLEYTRVAERALQARIVWLTELCTLRGDAAGQRDVLLAQPAALPSLFTLWPAGRARNAPLLTSRQLPVFYCM